MVKDKFVRIVFGDVLVELIGIIDCYDYLIKNGGLEMYEYFDFLMIDVEVVKKEV